MPAVYSPSTSMYSWPSASHSRQPSPRTTVERERRIVQRGTGVAAGHRLARFLVAREALGVAGDIGLPHLVEGGLQVRIDQR